VVGIPGRWLKSLRICVTVSTEYRETRVRCGLMFCDIMAFIVTTVLPDMDHVTALSSGTSAVCCVVDL